MYSLRRTILDRHLLVTLGLAFACLLPDLTLDPLISRYEVRNSFCIYMLGRLARYSTPYVSIISIFFVSFFQATTLYLRSSTYRDQS
ncbi:hypothetical protein BGZ63DRAFT_385475 [Mariannaea sp. PMI_226]|nr:hypothetical protein BGZ63DRAFT_385475 [Mariannaea sp. PMI_226]